MMIDHVRRFVLPAAFDVLPSDWHTPEADALLLAIGLQESGFVHRHQIGGPARGFWQFELSGVSGVLQHPDTAVVITDAVDALCFPGPLRPVQLLELLACNDTIAAVCARCLLHALPERLPSADQPMAAWHLYTSGWRPGRPRLDAWSQHYEDAWTLVHA